MTNKYTNKNTLVVVIHCYVVSTVRKVYQTLAFFYLAGMAPQVPGWLLSLLGSDQKSPLSRLPNVKMFGDASDVGRMWAEQRNFVRVQTLQHFTVQ